MQLTASGEAGCYQLAVEEPPAARGLPELTLALSRTAKALAQVEERPEAVAAMLGHLAQQRRRRAQLRRVVPLAAVAGLALCVAGAWATWQSAEVSASI